MKKALILLAVLALTVSIKAQSIKNLYTFDKIKNKLELDISKINLFEQRMHLLYSLENDKRFDVTMGKNDGVFVIKAAQSTENTNLERTFNGFFEETAIAFNSMTKDEIGDLFHEWKSSLPNEFISSMMMDIYRKDRQNNHCNTADPFCTDNGQYQFPAGVNAGSGESGPNYNCLSTTPNPAWYYMRMATAGAMTIHMYSTPSHDIDFCCWGPFEDPVTPCPTGLTAAKVVSCSYSTSATENCQIPSSAQPGQYYILVITNFSNQSCNITFSKTAGTGTTDCNIMPPLVSNNGPYCVGQTISLSGNAQSGATYSWSGPGGWTSSGQNPTRPNCTMAMAGQYTCTITLNGQTSSANTEVSVYANPTANFNSTTVCVGNATQFTSTSTTNPSGQQITSYLWDFGDGQTSTQQNPTHTFAGAGTHQVSLTVACGQNTCTHSVTKSVTVDDYPVANAGPDQSINNGHSATLTAQTVQGQNVSYAWTPANKINGNPNLQTVQTVALEQTTTFKLRVTRNGCQSEEDDVVVNVGSAMSASASIESDEICDGNSTTVTATASGGEGPGSYHYQWQATPSTVEFGDATASTTTVHPTRPGDYILSCTVTDGHATLSTQTNLTVNPAENMDVTIAVCPSELPYVLDLPDGTQESFNEETIPDGWHTTVPNSFGCNVNVSLYLTINEVVTNVFTEETCNEPFTYYEDGVAIKTLHETCVFDTVYPYGDCEKHLIINFTRHEVYDEHNADEYVSINYPEHHCMEYTWPSNGQTYTERGRYPWTFQTINYCDSIVTLVLDEGNLSFTVDPGPSSAMTVDTCKNYGGYYLWGAEKIWSTDSYPQLFPSASSQGCDSIGYLDIRLYERPSIDSIAGDKLVIPGIGFMPYVYEYKIVGIAGAGMDGDNPDYPTHPEDFNWEVLSYYDTPNRINPDDPDNFESSWQIGFPDENDKTRVYVYINAEGNAVLKCELNTLCGPVSIEKFIYTEGYQHGESVNEYNYENMVNIFPNPTSGELYIGYSELLNTTPLILTIYDYKGAVIDQFYSNTESTVTHYSMSNLPNGLYLVKFTGKDFVVTKKFVLSR